MKHSLDFARVWCPAADSRLRGPGRPRVVPDRAPGFQTHADALGSSAQRKAGRLCHRASRVSETQFGHRVRALPLYYAVCEGVSQSDDGHCNFSKILTTVLCSWNCVSHKYYPLDGHYFLPRPLHSSLLTSASFRCQNRAKTPMDVGAYAAE